MTVIDNNEPTHVKNTWKFTADSPHGTQDTILIAENHGTFLTFASDGDNPTNHPYRIKYVHFLDDDESNAGDSDRWAGFFVVDRANLHSQIAFALTGSKSYEKSTVGDLERQLDPGRLVMLSHYRAALAGFTHLRKVEYGIAHDLPSIEASFTASEREVGDAYICLEPVVEGVYEAVVVEAPDAPGTKTWAMVSQVQV